MKKLLILSLIGLIFGACGTGRPLPPTIGCSNGSSYFTPFNGNNGSSASTFDQTLSNITLFWDVSDINGAAGVEIIMATHNSCDEKYTVAIQSVLGLLVNDSNTNGNNVYNMNNLSQLFGLQYGYNVIQPGQYYICLKVVKYNGSKSPASWPAYLRVYNNVYYY